ncbi:MAG: glycoside hydrolase family 172 protein [bacterium]
MMRNIARISVVVSLTLLGALTLHGAESAITLKTLLADMTNRDALARWPQPAYTCKQASSYDRRQTIPNGDRWHANIDYKQFIRIEENEGRQEWVLMEHDGPGAVVRFWIPLERKNCLVRFYFDGSSTPAIAVKLHELLAGRGFVKPPLAFIASDEAATTGLGGDLYLPIPFAKSCKITLDEIPYFFIVGYRAYETGTKVETFTMANFEMAADALKRNAELLQSLGNAVSGQETRREGEIQPGAALSLDLPAGENAVRSLQLELEPRSDTQTVRSVVLAVEFDGQPTVWCPIGEFFGCGARWNPVQDWNRTVATNGTLATRWVMPYKKNGRITVKNLGKVQVTVKLAVSTSAWRWDDRSMYFHAGWRHEDPIKTRPYKDWNYVELTGQGVYVGDTLTVFNRDWHWNGEGDERVYVDGEKFPSHLGTGMEDYYGYAWGMAHWFNSPFIAMPKRDVTYDHRWKKPDWSAYTTTSRMRLLDGIPYRRSLKFDMELWVCADTEVSQAVGVFWYARPSGTSNRVPQPEEAVRDLIPWNGKQLIENINKEKQK